MWTLPQIVKIQNGTKCNAIRKSPSGSIIIGSMPLLIMRSPPTWKKQMPIRPIINHLSPAVLRSEASWPRNLAMSDSACRARCWRRWRDAADAMVKPIWKDKHMGQYPDNVPVMEEEFSPRITYKTRQYPSDGMPKYLSFEWTFNKIIYSPPVVW